MIFETDEDGFERIFLSMLCTTLSGDGILETVGVGKLTMEHGSNTVSVELTERMNHWTHDA